MRPCLLCSLPQFLSSLVTVAAAAASTNCDSVDHDVLLDNQLQLQHQSPKHAARLTIRQEVSSSSSSDPAASTSTASPQVLPSSYVMPSAFDAILGVNFTSTSCPDFFQEFLSDDTFKTCYPLSLLLETSTSFFRAMKNDTLLPAVMDQVCAADLDTCTTKMNQLATEIQQNDRCGSDISKGNALAVSALNGFKNFPVLYRAGCLQDSTDSNKEYCFTKAAQAETASDLYLYYVPGGTSLPSGTRPSCDACSKAVMGVYSEYASNSTLPISSTYGNTRNTLAITCGPSFAPMVAATLQGSSSRNLASHLVSLMIAVVLFAFRCI